MNPSLLFVLHFARLLSQILLEPANRDAHRATVDDLLEANQESVTLIWVDWSITVDGGTVPPSMPGVKDLAARMAGHGLRGITFGRGVEPGHVLGVGQLLAGTPDLGDGGSAAIARLNAMDAPRISFVSVGGVETTPADAPAPRVSTMISSALLLDDFELQELEPIAPSRPAQAPAEPTARPSARPAKSPEEMIEQLRRVDIDTFSATLDALAGVIHARIKSGETAQAAALVAAVIELRPLFNAPIIERRYRHAVRDMADTYLLKAVVADLPRVGGGENRALYMSIFAAIGEDAVDVLLEQLTYAEQARERRALFDAIVELGLGVPTLLRMLTDDRWYVARNAAELLGRLKVSEAVPSLIDVLRHPEARVRRSAALALARIGTPSGLAALEDAIRDPSPGVRLHAILAVAERRESRIVSTIMRALDSEKDLDVQRAIFAALGKIGTPEAVQRLIQAAEDSGSLFRRAPTPIRVAAIRALAEAQTPEAVAAIQSLTTDRDREVRTSAERGLAARNSDGTTRGGAGW